MAFVFGVMAFLIAFEVDIEGPGVNIDQHRSQFQQSDYLNRCSKGEIGCDHLVTRLETETHHRNLKGVRAVGTGDHVLDSQIVLQVRLERFDFGSVDKCR